MAERAIAKLEAALPPLPVEAVDRASHPLVPVVLRALREGRKLHLHYSDRKERRTARVVWPVALDDPGDAPVLAAWDELRGDFRHFRLDRIASLELGPESVPRSRRRLLAIWRSRGDPTDW